MSPPGESPLAKWYFGKHIPDFLAMVGGHPRDGEAPSPSADGPVQPTDDVNDDGELRELGETGDRRSD